MLADERDRRIEVMFKEDMGLLKRKGHDYASSDDSLRNFRTWGVLGILIRMDDKMSRLRGYAQGKGFSVQDEGVKDTLRDLRNYSFLAQVLMEEGEET